MFNECWTLDILSSRSPKHLMQHSARSDIRELQLLKVVASEQAGGAKHLDPFAPIELGDRFGGLRKDEVKSA